MVLATQKMVLVHASKSTHLECLGHDAKHLRNARGVKSTCALERNRGKRKRRENKREKERREKRNIGERKQERESEIESVSERQGEKRNKE